MENLYEQAKACSTLAPAEFLGISRLEDWYYVSASLFKEAPLPGACSRSPRSSPTWKPQQSCVSPVSRSYAWPMAGFECSTALCSADSSTRAASDPDPYGPDRFP